MIVVLAGPPVSMLQHFLQNTFSANASWWEGNLCSVTFKSYGMFTDVINDTYTHTHMNTHTTGLDTQPHGTQSHSLTMHLLMRLDKHCQNTSPHKTECVVLA